LNQITSLQQQQNQTQQITKKESQMTILRMTKGKRKHVLKKNKVGDTYRINDRKKGDKYINKNCF
jgi:hypothetical protein